MQRYIYARCRADLNRIRRPGGKGFVGHSPIWIDTHESRDFYCKLARKGQLEVLDEKVDDPRTESARAAARRKQAESDLEGTRSAIKAAEKELGAVPSKKLGKDERASKEAAIEERLAVLRATEKHLADELGEEE